MTFSDTDQSMKKKVTKKASGKKEQKVVKAAKYDQYKKFGGKQYTGMAIGRSHTWHYDEGLWKEKKLAPDEWEIHYSVNKRRAGHAPEGSGAPVGTEYHWFILAHQYVKKLDANTYSTSMQGTKLKVAHKRSVSPKWNISDATQRKHLIEMLKNYVEELEAQDGAGAPPPGIGTPMAPADSNERKGKSSIVTKKKEK